MARGGRLFSVGMRSPAACDEPANPNTASSTNMRRMVVSLCDVPTLPVGIMTRAEGVWIANLRGRRTGPSPTARLPPAKQLLTQRLPVRTVGLAHARLFGPKRRLGFIHVALEGPAQAGSFLGGAERSLRIAPT